VFARTLRDKGADAAEEDALAMEDLASLMPTCLE
jgi:hypothetical protein